MFRFNLFVWKDLLFSKEIYQNHHPVNCNRPVLIHPVKFQRLFQAPGKYDGRSDEVFAAKDEFG
jgi:hypothetical protein